MTDFKSELRKILEPQCLRPNCTVKHRPKTDQAINDIIALFNKQLLEKERGILYAIDRYLRLASDPAKEIEEYITNRLADIKGEIE
jgi:hypothetical protein